MDDVCFHFRKRVTRNAYPNVRIHYSTSDEEVIVRIVDRKRLSEGNNFVRDDVRLSNIRLDLINYFKSRDDVVEVSK